MVSCTAMNQMKAALAERNIVVVLFVLVFVIFTLAQRDSKRLQKLYMASQSKHHTPLASKQNASQPLLLK